MRAFLCCLACLVWTAAAAPASELAGLAHLRDGGASAADTRGGAEVTLRLTQAVPWRVRRLADPPAIALDFRDVAWTGLAPDALTGTEAITEVATGRSADDWSRIILRTNGPMRVAAAEMTTGPDAAEVTLVLEATTEAALADTAEAAPPAPTAPPLRARQDGARPLTIVLDPGHGGVDPGAEHGTIREADLVLQFAQELKDVLLRAGYDVVLTRADDSFVALHERLEIARSVQADVLLSLHADALEEGDATGTSLYTLPLQAAPNLPSAAGDAPLGASVADPAVTAVLADLTHRDTRQRSARLADALVIGIEGAGITMYKHPRLEGAFKVLSAPDTPSVLLELGFISSKADRERILSPDWRQRLAIGLVEALGLWAVADAAEVARLRR